MLLPPTEVVIPFSPTDWQLAFDGERASLQPSISNWNFACRSHYWIKGNCVGRLVCRSSKSKTAGHETATPKLRTTVGNDQNYRTNLYLSMLRLARLKRHPYKRACGGA